MKVLLYTRNETKPLELLQRVVSKIISSNDLKKINSIDVLWHQLKNNTITKNNETITILLIADLNELQELLKISKQLKETRIILILPDKEYYTLKLGHTLFPRYLDFIDSNFTEVGEVLKKIINQIHE
jgi:hypothetical protein